MRGKHGTAAAARRETASYESDIATYQRAVASLTAERDHLRSQVRDEAQRHRRAERELRARLDHAAAPRVSALEMQLQESAEKLRHASAEAVKWRDERQRVINHYGRHLVNDVGLTFEDAISVIGGLLLAEEVLDRLEFEAATSGATSEQVETARRFDKVLSARTDAQMRMQTEAKHGGIR